MLPLALLLICGEAVCSTAGAECDQVLIDHEVSIVRRPVDQL